MTELPMRPMNGVPLELETTRLLLRELREADFPFLLQHYSDKAISKFTLLHFTTIEEVREHFQLYCDPGQKSRVKLGIELKEGRQLIGTVCFLDWCTTHNVAELGYDLKPAFWGHGYMTETLVEFLKYGFDEMRLNRVEATTHVSNIPSQKLLRRVGFLQEGKLRQKYYNGQEYQDELIFSLLREEWINSA